MDGKSKTLKPVSGFAFVELTISPSTKSASSTIAAFGGSENAFVTDVGKSVWSAPCLPPAMLSVSLKIFAISVRASFTDWSVHGI